MTSIQRAWAIVIYFWAMLPVSYLCKKWILKAELKLCGKTMEEFKQARKRILQNGTSRHGIQMEFEHWMIQGASDPKKYRRLAAFEKFSLMPNLLLALISFYALYSHAFDKIFFVGVFAVPAIALISLVVGIWYKAKNR